MYIPPNYFRFRALCILLSLILLASLPFLAKAQLSGSYTINWNKSASANNYTSLDDAVIDLLTGKRYNSATSNGPGVSGPVVFKLADGSYVEHTKITKINGASSKNTITFISASGDSTKTTLRFYGSTKEIISLSGASYINIKNITFAATGYNGNPASFIRFESGANNNNIKGCRFVGNPNDLPVNLIYASDADSNNTIENNLFRNFKYGIFSELLSTSTGLYTTGIKNNVFDSGSTTGISLRYANNIVCTGNKLNLQQISLGMDFNNCGGSLFISKNIIFAQNAISAEGSSGLRISSGEISNNMLNTSAYGISVTKTKNIGIHYNTLQSFQYKYTSAMYIDADSTRIVNNDIVNFANGFAVYYTSSLSGLKSDYNNIYCPDSALGSWGTKKQKTLKDWTKTTGLDSHSVSINPLFRSTNDLHALSPLLKAAIPISSITTDIDNISRSSKKPVIGANEYNIYHTDAGINAIDSLLPAYCRGDSKSMFARLANYGTDTLTSTTINWTINGKAQTGYSWSGKLAPGKTLVLKIGTIAFNRTGTIKCWTTKFNTLADSNHTNDTASVYEQVKMNSSYTLGGYGADFKGFNDAVAELIRSGVCSSVVINAKDSIYKEQVTLPLISGAGPLNTITFQSKSGDSTKAVIQVASSSDNTKPNFVVKIDQGKYYILKNLGFVRTGTDSNACVLLVVSGSDSNSFIGNQFVGNKSYPKKNHNFYNNNIVDLQNSGFNYVYNNLIRNGAIGIIDGYNASNPGYAFQTYGNQFIGNTIDSSYYNALYCSGSMFTVANNKILNILSHSAVAVVVVTGDSFFIRSNKIFLPNGGTAINAGMTPATHIENNFISISANPYFGVSNGIYFYTVDCGYVGCKDFNAYVYNNSVNITGIDTSSSDIYYYDQSSYKNNATLYVYNNNFVNAASGYCVIMNTRSIIKSDYNNYRTNGRFMGGLPTYKILPYATISSWTKATGLDSNSISMNTWYVNAIDLHSQNPNLAKKGKHLRQPSSDIDGLARNFRPTIGANELKPKAADAGVKSLILPSVNFCAGTNEFFVSLRNYGTDTLKKDSIVWQLAGIPQKPFFFTGKIAPGDSNIVDIGSGKMLASTSNDWFTSKYPNSTIDSNKNNDTARFNFNAAMSGVFTIGGTNPDFKTVGQAVNTLIVKKMCGPVIFSIRDGIYKEQVSLPNIVGSSPVNTLTFKSESGDSSKVIITYPSSSIHSDSNYVFRLDSAANVTFNQISFIRTGTSSNGAVLEFVHNVMRNTFLGCRILGIKQDVPGSSKAGLVSHSDSWSYENVFRNCILKYGTSVNTDISAYILYYLKGVDTFDHNIVDSCISGFGPHSYVSHNSISNFVYDAVRGDFCVGNRIYSPINATEVLYNCYVYNNIISTSAPLVMRECGRIYYNNIMMFGNKMNCDGYYKVIDQGNSGIPIIKNNNMLFALNSPQLGKATYKFIIPNNNIDSTMINHNNAYTSSVNVFDYVNVFLLYPNSNTTYGYAFTDWGSSYSKIYYPDKNSVTIDPMVVSVNYPEALNTKLAHKGTPIAGITTDIYGNKRDTLVPSIGAVEIKSITQNVALTYINANQVCGDSAYAISVVVQNRGSANASKIPVFAEISKSGNTQKIADTIASVKAFATDTFTFKARATLYYSGTYNIKAYTALNTDFLKKDDTLNTTVFIVGNNLPSRKNITICTAGKARITLNDVATNDKVAWYKNLTDAIPISTKDTFITKGIIYKDTTFYVSQSTPQSIHTLKKDTSTGITAQSTNTCNLVLMPVKDCSIDTVTVYPQHSGYFRIVLTDYYASGSPLKYYYYPIKVTVQTAYQPVKVPLNIKLSATYYRRYNLYIDSIHTGNLAFSRTLIPEEGLFPIFVPGVITFNSSYITNLNNGVCYNSTWPYMYDMVISTSCPAQRFPFKVHVGGKPTFSLDKDPASEAGYNAGTLANPDQVCLRNKAAYRIFTSYPDTDYAYTWKIKTVLVQTLSGSGTKDTQLVKPSAKNIGTLNFTPQSYKSTDSIYKITMTIGAVSGTGCDTTVTRYIRVVSSPVVKFFVNNGCQGKALTFKDSSTVQANAIYNWDFGDTTNSNLHSPSHTYKNTGSYKVSLTIANQNGCGDNYTKTITINNYPKASMTIDTSNCLSVGFNFYDNSTNLSGFKRRWFYGDGDIDSTGYAYHLYKSAGTYQMKLLITNANGCADSLTKKISVYPVPKAAFSIPAAVCLHVPVNFKDSSLYINGNKRFWDLGDGTTDTATQLVHTYANTGTYKIKLLIITKYGCRDSLYKTVVVNPLPKAVFGADTSACFNAGIKVKDVSGIARERRLWNFGDGITDTSAGLVHFYKSAAAYTIKLSVINAYGCKDSVTRKVQVHPMPKAIWNIDSSVCKINAIGYKDLTGSSDGHKRNWYFGDAGSDTASTGSHVYKTNGTYNAKLVVTTPFGCKDSLTRKILVNPMPKAVFVNDSAACLGNPINFKDNSKHASGDSTTWFFSDGQKGSGLTLKHFYAVSGSFMPKLVISTSFGCRDSATGLVHINKPPKAGFHVSDVCLGNSSYFLNTSTDTNGEAGMDWKFDDSTNSSAISPAHLFQYAGNHKATLIVHNGTGCLDSLIVNFKVNPLPTPDFNISVMNLNVKYNAIDSLYSRYKWDFGDSTSDSSGFRLSHTYKNGGVYSTHLKVTNAESCMAEKSNMVIVKKSAVANLEDGGQIIIYPNPFTTQVNISIELVNTSSIQWNLYDAIGKRVAYSEITRFNAGKHLQTLNTSKLPDGVYNLELIINGQKINRTLISVKP